MIGVFELIVLLSLGGLLLMGAIRVFGTGARPSRGGGISFGHATLNCPHCGQETRSEASVCQQCGRDL